MIFFFFQAEDGIRDDLVTGVQTCALPISSRARQSCRDALHATLWAHDVDVVHMHGVDFAEYLPPPNVPVLATLHLPIQWYSPRAVCPEIGRASCRERV